MQINPSSLSWAKVEKYLSEKTASGNALALVETEKIFQKVLEKLKFPGKTTKQKMAALKIILPDFEKFERARKIYKDLLSTLDFEIKTDQLEEILTTYYKAIEKMVHFQKEKHDLFYLAKIHMSALLPKPKDFFKKIGIGLVIFFFIVFVLDSTKIGKDLVWALVQISHFIFSWVLFAALLIVGVVILVLGSLFYLQSKKKEKMKKS